MSRLRAIYHRWLCRRDRHAWKLIREDRGNSYRSQSYQCERCGKQEAYTTFGPWTVLLKPEEASNV